MASQATPLAAAPVIAVSAPVIAQPASLLSNLLEDAPALSAALSNVAHNLGQLDASFTLLVEHNFAEMSAGLEEWSAGHASAMAASGVQVSELQGDTLARLGHLQSEVGGIVTTAVGSLQSANLHGSFDASGLIEHILFHTDHTSLTVEHRGGIQDLVALQNLSLNSGEVMAAASLHMADTQTRIDNVTTTAIGALQSGALNTAVDLTATVQGRIGQVADLTSIVVSALVGT